MDFITIIIVVFIITIVVAIVQVIITSSNKKAMSERIKSIPNFIVTQEIMGNDGLTGIAYDDKNKKVCLINKNGNDFNQKLFSYRDILSSEILEDGNSITKTERGSQIGGALIGGLALGPVGLLIGGLTGKKKSIDKIKRVDIQIIVNDTTKPRHLINFLNTESKKDSFIYKSSIETARQWHAIIEVLIKKADLEDEEYNLRVSNRTSATYSISDELKKLSDLKNSGILTESEFQQQKRKLLNK